MLIFISYSRTNAYTYVCALARELKIYVCMMVIYTLCACVAHRNIYGARITMLSVCLTTSSLRAFLAYKHRYRMHSTDRTKEREREYYHTEITQINLRIISRFITAKIYIIILAESKQEKE